jgi:RNA polymerase sigma-70 factor, ECF subfamily
LYQFPNNSVSIVNSETKNEMQSHTEIIWNRFHLQLLEFIERRVKDKTTADDILQEVFIKIQLNLKSLKEDTKIQPWIFQIARNTVNDYYRKLKTGESLDEKIDPIDEDRGGEVMKEVEGWLGGFIDDLPEKYRDAIIYSEIDQMPQKEMAEKLGISYINARARVQRGRKLLKNNLEMCCEFFTDQYGNVIDYRERQKNCNNC